MELIPIIYTVLEIVVVLTILTLAVSYIGYKMRQKREITVNNYKPNANLFEPLVKDASPLKYDRRQNDGKLADNPNETKPVSKKNAAAPVLKQVDEKKENSTKGKKKDDINNRPPQKDHSKQKIEPRAAKPKINNDRISVLKNLSTPNAEEDISKTKSVKSSGDKIQTFGDDILGKYMEDGDNDMFTLKITKKAKPKENE